MSETKKPSLTAVAAASSAKKSPLKNGANGANGASKRDAARPSVVSLNYPDKKTLARAYMPFLKGGGLFLPTSQGYDMGEEIFLLVTLPDSQKPIPVPGSVVWRTPSGATDGRRQGIGIEFKGREGNSLRSRVEGILGAKLNGSAETYTM
ncbi:MAG: PilZ domain-containing protein [Pseudomonadota bacterium]